MFLVRVFGLGGYARVGTFRWYGVAWACVGWVAGVRGGVGALGVLGGRVGSFGACGCVVVGCCEGDMSIVRGE